MSADPLRDRLKNLPTIRYSNFAEFSHDRNALKSGASGIAIQHLPIVADRVNPL